MEKHLVAGIVLFLSIPSAVFSEQHQTLRNCPDMTFREFLSIFSENQLIQHRYASFPLQVKYVDSLNISYDPMIFSATLVKRKSTGFLFPNRYARKQIGLNLLKIRNTKKGGKHVTISKSDKYSQNDYYFSRTPKNCWRLYKIVYSNQ